MRVSAHPRTVSILVGAACVAAAACSPDSGVVGDARYEQEQVARGQAVDGAKAVGVAGVAAPYPSMMTPRVWVDEQKLRAADGAAGQFFGSVVSLSGDTALVGFASAGDASGAAQVFVRTESGWALQQKLVASDGELADYFGARLSLSGDTALVGAFGDDDLASGAGAAYVFVRAATGWTEQVKLLAGDGAAGDAFGSGVAVGGDVAIVGASGDDDAGSASGSAYVFVRSAAIWAQQDKLVAGDGSASAWLGGRVSLSGDTALLGARGDDAEGTNAGAAYVFVRNATSWAEQQRLVASDAAQLDEFGFSVSVSGDTVLVGARGNGEKAAAAGAAYVFVRTATSWTEQQKLVASDGVAQELFGTSVSLHDDRALVGVPQNGDRGYAAGSVYVFQRVAVNWSEQQKLTANDGAAGDRFGGSVSLSGGRALIGARLDDDAGSNAGSAYVVALRLVDGQQCSDATACASAFCVDGVCCESACDDSCEACAALGFEGRCTPLPRDSLPTPSCGGYLCNGSANDCPYACAGDGDCRSSYHCQNAVACLPKGADGAGCSREEGCVSGHCVDGICCAEACDQGCGSCSVAGFEGACTSLEQDHPGVPGCAPYLCTGGDTACPSSCSAHRDCAKQHHCESSVCRADVQQGAACGEDDTCATGHCTDGVCCVVDDCGAYRCGPVGACEVSCSSNAQCASGHECNSDGKCEPRSAGAIESGACHLASVSTGTGEGLRWHGVLALLASLGLVWRRRRPITDGRGS